MTFLLGLVSAYFMLFALWIHVRALARALARAARAFDLRIDHVIAAWRSWTWERERRRTARRERLARAKIDAQHDLRIEVVALREALQAHRLPSAAAADTIVIPRSTTPKYRDPVFTAAIRR